MDNGATKSGSAGVVKRSWPELVGADAEHAKAMVKEQNPSVTPTIVPEGSFVTCDYRQHRVRIYINSETNKVVSGPKTRLVKP
ncbi:hypothetical protein SUGI_1077300 [Cryptomeria japonica]|nr:hypothetical protein SUGI_1077300 [Cryptomeria japonica]